MNAMANPPSIPFPESAERRAAITSQIQAATGLDEAALERLVRSFYATARRHEVIGHLFDGIADREKHIATITAFWSSVGLLTGRYHGQPLAAHSPSPLEPLHFVRWLMLFELTARDTCSPEGADYLVEKAHRIARSLEMGLAVSRGELPSRIGASHEQ
jgi:hemoglobin